MIQREDPYRRCTRHSEFADRCECRECLKKEAEDDYKSENWREAMERAEDTPEGQSVS